MPLWVIKLVKHNVYIVFENIVYLRTQIQVLIEGDVVVKWRWKVKKHKTTEYKENRKF